MILKLFCLPQRYVFAVMGFLVTLVGYMMRISLDVTISSMVNQTVTTTPQQYDPYSCPDLIESNQTYAPVLEHEEQGIFDWDSNTQKSIFSAFRTSYIMTQFLGGMVAERKGGKKIMSIALTVLSVSTFLIPFASKLLGSKGLYVLRFLSGMASGTIIPILLSMMSKWVPKDEQAVIASIIFPGYLVGYVMGSWLGYMMVNTIGWEAVFYAFGLFGGLCSLLWTKLVYSTPNEHPTISDCEKRYLNEHVISLKRTTKYELDPFPMKAFVRCGAFWGTAMGYVGREWALSIFTTQVPQFLKEVLRLDISYSPFFVFMPYIFMWLAALLCGFICDILIKKGVCSAKNARKIFTAIGTVGSAVCIIMVMYSRCNPILAIFAMFTGMALIGAFYSGCMIGALDIAPNYAGSTIGAIDNIAINSVLLMPRINAMVMTDALLQQWRLSMWIVVVLLLVCIAVYFYYVEADQMWWDDVRKNGYPGNWKHGLLACEGIIDEHGKSIFKASEKDERTAEL